MLEIAITLEEVGLISTFASSHLKELLSIESSLEVYMYNILLIPMYSKLYIVNDTIIGEIADPSDAPMASDEAFV